MRALAEFLPSLLCAGVAAADIVGKSPFSCAVWLQPTACSILLKLLGNGLWMSHQCVFTSPSKLLFTGERGRWAVSHFSQLHICRTAISLNVINADERCMSYLFRASPPLVCRTPHSIPEDFLLQSSGTTSSLRKFQLGKHPSAASGSYRRLLRVLYCCHPLSRPA